MSGREVIIKDTHRGIWYEDGVLTRVLPAGRYELPRRWNLPFHRRPQVELVLVDIRERDLNIKGQEILTGDKVAVRVNLIARFQVTNPEAALHTVESYEDRLYSDVQLAARRSLASMSLEEILTNRNRLSDDILNEVKEAAATYGVTIIRADVKDLVFPGNLQEIMNRVLTAERLAEAQLVEARTKVEVQRISAQAETAARRQQAELESQTRRLSAEGEAEERRIRTDSEVAAVRAMAESAAVYSAHPALLRLRELETLASLSGNPAARIYIGFDKHGVPEPDPPGG
jgi:regulator of protease activity HflC (stomatin/prohibitin superfamily)